MNGLFLGSPEVAVRPQQPSRALVPAVYARDQLCQFSGCRTFSSPLLAASISIIFRRSLVFVSPNDFIVPFTNSIVAKSMQMFVAVLSDRQIISAATSCTASRFVEEVSEDTASSDLNTVFDYDSVSPRYIAFVDADCERQQYCYLDCAGSGNSVFAETGSTLCLKVL